MRSGFLRKVALIATLLPSAQSLLAAHAQPPLSGLPTDDKPHTVTLTWKASPSRVSGYNVNEMRPREVPMLRRKLGIVFQDFRLLEDRTAEENVAFALEVTGARSSTIPARVMRVLTQVGLAAKAQAYPRELSGGEQQRVAIARALVNEPTVLLADEPTGNLDERATRGVFQLLRDINASGTAVVMATHDLDLVRQAPYRVIELQEGALVYDSAVDEQRDQAAAP